MSARKQRKMAEATLPRTDAPEHPVDPADAAFLDPAAAARVPGPAPSKASGDAPRPPGYGDFEGERGRASERKDKD